MRKRSGREENINSRTESDRDQGRKMQKGIDKSSETKQRHSIIRKQTDIKTWNGSMFMEQHPYVPAHKHEEKDS